MEEKKEEKVKVRWEAGRKEVGEKGKDTMGREKYKEKRVKVKER